jgi:hypothetical protein
MKFRIITIILVVLSALSLSPGVVLAYDEGVCLANDWTGNWWTDAQGFANVIDAYSGWNNYYTSNDPYPSWWKEESASGADNYYADYCELSLIQGHSASSGSTKYIGFGSRGYASANDVRLGYESPDDYGYNIWSFIIECSLFNDANYVAWAGALTGTHMLLGFKNDPWISTTDLTELANRLTGSGGYSQQNVQWAFFDTYVCGDGLHYDNIARILAENASVADYDYLNSFSTQITVDSTKIVIEQDYP